MGIAIAISAAATTKIRNTSTAPAAVPVCCANVTSDRLTPFSISSMHISITSRLRRTITPRSPSAKSASESARSACTLSTAPPASFDDGECGDDGGYEQHRRQLELQPVLVEESGGELLQPKRYGERGPGLTPL